MNNELLEGMRELKSVAPRLNESSDSLNSILSQINDRLNEMNFGLTVWLDGPPLTSKGIEPSYFQKKHRVFSVVEKEILGYAKLKNGWGLAVMSIIEEHGLFEGDENCPFTNVVDGEVKPLLDCSRDIRTESVRLLPQLFGLLKHKAETAIKDLEEAKKFASQI
jgi:hypothetical protein